MPQPRPTAPVWTHEITKSTQSAAVHASELRHMMSSELSRAIVTTGPMDDTMQGRMVDTP